MIYDEERVAVKALNGVKVLDLSRVLAGPHCCMIMGDLGADVIKIEKPVEGDLTRGFYPRIEGESTYFLAHNRNKKSITLDLRKEKAKEIFLRLVKDADVVVENFRAGTMEKMGLGYENLRKVNPGIILTRISGFGQEGPYADRACFDGAAQALSGLIDITGPKEGKPCMIGTFVVDYTAALYAVIGTLAALRRRNYSGEGEEVDIALLDAAFSLLHTAVPDYEDLGLVFSRNGNGDRYAWPADLYGTKDGQLVYISAGLDNMFKTMMGLIGKEEVLSDPRFRTKETRKEHVDVCNGLIEGWTKTKTADEIVALVSAKGIPCAKVNNVEEAIHDPQLNYRRMIRDVTHETAGTIHLCGQVLHFSEQKMGEMSAPPRLGGSNREIYSGWLGMAEKEIEQLYKEKVI